MKLCIPYNYFDEKEIFCVEQKYFPLIIKLLNKQINDNKKKFDKIIFAKQEQNEEMELVGNYISHLKIFLSKEKNEDLIIILIILLGIILIIFHQEKNLLKKKKRKN